MQMSPLIAVARGHTARLGYKATTSPVILDVLARPSVPRTDGRPAWGEGGLKEESPSDHSAMRESINQCDGDGGGWAGRTEKTKGTRTRRGGGRRNGISNVLGPYKGKKRRLLDMCCLFSDSEKASERTRLFPKAMAASRAGSDSAKNLPYSSCRENFALATYVSRSCLNLPFSIYASWNWKPGSVAHYVFFPGGEFAISAAFSALIREITGLSGCDKVQTASIDWVAADMA